MQEYQAQRQVKRGSWKLNQSQVCMLLWLNRQLGLGLDVVYFCPFAGTGPFNSLDDVL